MVSQTFETNRLSYRGSRQPSIRGITELTRLEFLQKSLETKKYSKSTIDLMFKGLASSATRQYQSGWKKFQNFISVFNVTKFDSAVFANFATWLLSKGLQPPTVNTHLAAIKDPMFHALNISSNQRDIQLILKGYLRDRPVVRKPPPQWSLEKVLEELQKEIYSNNSDTCCLLKKALFLVALGTGWRALHY